MSSKNKRRIDYFILLAALLVGNGACSVEKTLSPHYNADIPIHLELGLAYLDQNKPELAKYWLLLALEQGPHDELTQGAFAYFLEKTGEFKQAEQHYLLALRFAKHPGIARNNYGTFLCHRGRYAAAIDNFLAASKSPDYLNTADAYENAGLCALKIPNPNQAKIYFSKAVTIDPTRTRSLLEIAKIR